jgi:hypothetical protein
LCRSSCLISAVYFGFKTLKFCRNILVKFTKNKNFTEIHPVGADLFHPDGHTDMTKVIFCFSQLFLQKRLNMDVFQYGVDCPWKLTMKMKDLTLYLLSTLFLIQLLVRCCCWHYIARSVRRRCSGKRMWNIWITWII